MPSLPHVYQALLEPAYCIKGDMGSVRELACGGHPLVSGGPRNVVKLQHLLGIEVTSEVGKVGWHGRGAGGPPHPRHRGVIR